MTPSPPPPPPRPPVTPPHASVLAILNLVVNHQPWLQKMPAELVEWSQKEDFVLKTNIQDDFTP